MRGLPLNGNLLAAGATFVRETTTSPRYRLWSIEDRHPAMIRVAKGGIAVAVEVWDVPAAGLAASQLSARASARSRSTAGGARTSRRGARRQRTRSVVSARLEVPVASQLQHLAVELCEPLGEHASDGHHELVRGDAVGRDQPLELGPGQDLQLALGDGHDGRR